MISAPVAPPGVAWEIEFGGASNTATRAGLRLALPRLAGGAERIFGRVHPAGENEGFELFTAGELLLGYAIQPLGTGVEAASGDLYRRLLRAAAGRRLYRIWNYVPAINSVEDGIENYRAFSAGRSLAFEEACGPNFPHLLPAASAVGCGGRNLAAIFVAGGAEPRHLENPDQVPAYRYPPEHGLRSPSFSRATVGSNQGQPLVFVSGTAAIKGHWTVAPANLETQLECTVGNLRLMEQAAGIGNDRECLQQYARHVKVYLRRAEDFIAARTYLERTLLRPDDRIIWLQAELCRRALRVEIELTLVAPRADSA